MHAELVIYPYGKWKRRTSMLYRRGEVQSPTCIGKEPLNSGLEANFKTNNAAGNLREA